MYANHSIGICYSGDTNIPNSITILPVVIACFMDWYVSFWNLTINIYNWPQRKEQSKETILKQQVDIRPATITIDSMLTGVA